MGALEHESRMKDNDYEHIKKYEVNFMNIMRIGMIKDMIVKKLFNVIQRKVRG